QRGVLIHDETIVVRRDRRVVHRDDRDGHGRDAAVKQAVVDVVSEAVGAVVVGGGAVVETAITVQREGAVTGAVQQHPTEAVPIRVGVVGQDAGGSDGEGAVFIDTVVVIVVDRLMQDGVHVRRLVVVRIQVD